MWFWPTNHNNLAHLQYQSPFVSQVRCITIHCQNTEHMVWSEVCIINISSQNKPTLAVRCIVRWPHRWEDGCFPGDTCVLMFIVGSNVTLYEAKQKPVWTGWDSACVCVCARNVSIYVCVCVWRGGSVSVCGIIYSLCTHDGNLCVYMKDYVYCACDIVYIGLCVCVCCSVWWHLLRCWLGAEHSGPQEPQTKEMKAEVTTWTSGTRQTRSHNTQIQSHTCKPKDIHTECTHTDNTHTQQTYVSYTQQAGGAYKYTRTRD